MNRLLYSLLVFASLAVVARADRVTPLPEVYELRVYTVHPGKMPDLLARFRDHTCALFAKHHMVNIGYWLPMDKADGDKLYYVLKHQDREAAKNSWQTFAADPEWKAVVAASEANGKIVSAVESVYLASTDYSSDSFPPAGDKPRVFELRTYTTNEGKLDALDARFREHTLGLFARHGMFNMIYWHPLDADKGAGHTLVYLLAHESRDAAAASWKAFRDDPDWIKVRTESEKAGPLLVGPPKSIFLTPTDFSPVK